MKKDQPATAEGMLRRAIEYDPNNRAAHYLLAQLLQQLGRAEERKSSSPSPSGSRREARSDRARRGARRLRRRHALALLGAAPANPASAWPVRFVDVSGEAGLTHPITYGDAARKRFIIETNGCGVAMIDSTTTGGSIS